MANLTTVGLTAGAGSSGTGSVSTLDNVIGTAGTPSAQVQTVQGIASMTALKVDGSAVTQPVSIASLPSGAVTNAGTFAVQNTAATPAGTNLIGKMGIDQTTPGTTNGVVVNNANANGSAADASSAPVAFSTEGKASIGSLTETAPTTDTASSGLNGRLQRVAQRLSSMVALLPTALGIAAKAGSLGVAVATDQPALAIAQDTSQLMNGASNVGLTPLFAPIVASSSGATTIVAAVSGKKIRVLAWDLKVNAAVNFKWQSHVTPTDLTGLFYNQGQGDGVARAFNPVGYFQTVAGEALDINLSGAVAVGGSLVYVTV